MRGRQGRSAQHLRGRCPCWCACRQRLPSRALTAAFPPGRPLPAGRYSCGRLASDSYAPSPVALQLLWDRTHKLALTFDSQGIANILW